MFYLSICNLEAHCCSGFLVRDGRRKVRRVFSRSGNSLMDVSAWRSCPQSEDYGISGTVEVLCDIRTDLLGPPKCYLDTFCSSLPMYLSVSVFLLFSTSVSLSLSPHTLHFSTRELCRGWYLPHPSAYFYPWILCILAAIHPAESLAWPG